MLIISIIIALLTIAILYHLKIFPLPFGMMGDLVGKDASQISAKGGADVWYKRVTAAGADLATPDTWHPMGYQAKYDIHWEQPQDEKKDRSGEQVAVVNGDFTIGGLIALMQRGADTMIFLKDDVVGQYFALVSNHGLVTAGKTLEVFIPITQIARKAKFEEPYEGTDIEFKPIKNNASVTPASVPSGIKGAFGVFATAANKYFMPVETA